VLDLKLLRDEPDRVREALARRGVVRTARHQEPGSGTATGGLLDDVLAADARRREIVQKVDEKKHEHNVISKQMARATPEEREDMLAQARALKAEIDALEPRQREADEQLEMLAAGLPNLPHASVPDGYGDDDNVEIRRWGEPQTIAGAEDHLDIGKRLEVIDTDRAARASGTRFGYLLGDLVHVEFALVRFALDRLTPHGFVPVVPPVLVRREVMFGAGELPGDESQMYITHDGLYLTGTSEQSLVALHMDEDVEEDELPLRYAAFSTCFRREAGTYGRDTRGIFRVHQFDKVEMFSFAHPERSWDEFDFLVERQEELLQALEIPHRVTVVCTSEMGKKAAKQIDIEAWFPGQDRYRELTSCSNCTDYQARRLNVRMKTKGGRRLLHTLNGTAYAIGRTLVALLETFQEPDGGVEIPKVLHPYLPEGLTHIAAPG
jgi:seryl-tRNA synthetase